MRSDCDALRGVRKGRVLLTPSVNAGILVGQTVDPYKDVDVFCAFPILMLA
jgi:hypothetical protein